MFCVRELWIYEYNAQQANTWYPKSANLNSQNKTKSNRRPRILLAFDQLYLRATRRSTLQKIGCIL